MSATTCHTHLLDTVSVPAGIPQDSAMVATATCMLEQTPAGTDSHVL